MTRLSEDELLPCARDMLAMHRKVHEGTLKAVVDKYAGASRSFVSGLAPLDSL